MRVPALALLFAVLVPGLARAAGPELGPLEREAAEAALAARGLQLDPAPDGKRVGTVTVVNLDVFQPSDGGLLLWLNHFHRTTREDHIRRESLLQPGMVYDPLLVEETMRNLRNRAPYDAADPPVTSIVAMVPVQSSSPGTVDLMIVTRDVWSLRLNSDFNADVLSLNLPTLSASLSENNLFGWRKLVALTLVMNQGEIWLGPNYFDPNVLGTRLRLTAAVYEIWARKIGQLAAGPSEGSASLLRLEYPFYALAQRWGGFVQGSYTSSVQRDISSNGDDPNPTLARYYTPPGGGPGQCILPSSAPNNPFASLTADCDWRLRSGGVTSGFTRSFPGTALIQRLTAGHELGLNRLSFLPDFPQDAQTRARFAADFFGPSERTSLVYLQYDAFTPRYRTYRNLDSYDLGEDQRLGPWLTLKLGRASTLLGSDQDFFLGRAEAHVNLALGDGFQSIGAAWESRITGDGLLDELVTGNLYAATPVLGHAVRVVAAGTVALVDHNRHRSRSYVGGLEGLRGYPVNFFYGFDSYLAHLELRSLAFALASLRVGGLLFADAGDAADRMSSDAGTGQPGLALYGDAGLGVRVLVPQLNAEVLRCDWGIPLRDYAPGGILVYSAGLPGRLYCGFHQAF